MYSSFDLIFVVFVILQLFFSMMIMSMIARKKSKEKEASASEGNIKDLFDANCQKYYLTSREIEILKLLSEGLPYKLIADQLHISIRTVTTHVGNMFAKVKVTNKMELVSKLLNG